MSREPEREDQAILQALADLERPDSDRLPDLRDEEVCGYTALLALLPHALEPQAPPPQVRQRLLQRLRTRPAEAPAVVPLPAAGATPAPHPVAAVASRSMSSKRRWMQAMAASLMVGFLGLVIFLALQTRNQQRTIDALVVKLEERMDQQVELEHLRAQLLDFEQRFDMITTVAAGLYPLRAPQGASEADPLAPRGVMYVCANHQQWYLHLQNLQPTPRGQAYFLWFLTDEGPVEMKNFRVETFGQRVQFRRTSMPPKTHGVVLSMQPMGDAPQRPGGAVVLSGDHSIKL